MVRSLRANLISLLAIFSKEVAGLVGFSRCPEKPLPSFPLVDEN
jgi:hypothetical protein